jgi:hypothetical protein
MVCNRLWLLGLQGTVVGQIDGPVKKSWSGHLETAERRSFFMYNLNAVARNQRFLSRLSDRMFATI